MRTTLDRARPSAPAGPQLAATGLVIMWSSGFVGARLGTDHASADAILAWRFVIAAALLLAWAAMRRTWVPRGSRSQHAAVGLLTQCGYLGGVVTGVELGVPAGTAALIAALQPPVVGALAGRLLGERVSRRQWWGVWIGMVGVAIVVAGDLGRGTAPPAAYLLPLGGMAALSVGTLLERRWRPPGAVAETLTVHCLVGAVFFGAIAGSGDRLSPPPVGGFWLAVAWVVVLSNFGGYGFYLAVLRQGGATRVSTLLYLTPPTTMLWAFVMFGDPVTAAGLVGLVVCAVAVWLVLHRPRVTPGSQVRDSRRTGRATRASDPGARIGVRTSTGPATGLIGMLVRRGQ